jgi:putative aldouronate transport system permease protein
MVRSRSKTDKIIDSGLYLLLILSSLSVLYPFYYVVINSFNANLKYGLVYFIPESLTFKNYEIIFSDNTLLRAIGVSALRTVLGTCLTVFNCAICAFALRKSWLKFRNIYLLLFTIPMFFGGGLIPTFLNYRMLHIYDTFFVYIIPGIFNFFFVIILMTSFNDIPESMEESAYLDGANYFKIFIKIYLPMSLPVIATLALFTGVGQWNAWFDTMYFTRDQNLITLASVLLKIINQNNISQYMNKLFSDWQRNTANPVGIKLATIVTSVVPVLLIYPLMQKYFIKGVRIGAVKG